MSRSRRLRAQASHTQQSQLATTAAPPVELASAAALAPNTFSGLAVIDDVIPRYKRDIAQRAWQYYLEQGIVRGCIDAWQTFAIGSDIRITSDVEDAQEAVHEFAERINLVSFAKDMILQLLIKGDGVAFKTYEKGTGDILELVCVNPTSVDLTYEDGVLSRATQYADNPSALSQSPSGLGVFGESTAPADVYGTFGASGFQSAAAKDKDLPVENILHLKWRAPSFSPRGNSMILPAFRPIELLLEYHKAERAIAKRFTTPIRFIRVGGVFGDKTIMPTQRDVDQIRESVNAMSLDSGLVVPFFVEIKTYGCDGEALDVDNRVKSVKEDIMVALGLSRAIVSGDGPNFATASISMRKMVLMISEIKHAILKLLNWVVKDWAQIHGYEDAKFNYAFDTLDLENENDFRKLLVDLFDRGLISKQSLQKNMELDPVEEAANLESEHETIDLMSPTQTKPILDMVTAGIISVDEARTLLGLETLSVTEQQAATASLKECGGCGHYDTDSGRCGLIDAARCDDTPACHLFAARR